MNDAKPREWPTREEWAERRRTCYEDQVFAVEVDERLSSYLSPAEIQGMIEKLCELWKKLGREMRALAVPKELHQQPGEVRLYFRRYNAMTPDQQNLLEAEWDYRRKRSEINDVLKDLRGGVVPWRAMNEEVKLILEPVWVPYRAAREMAIEELEARIAATPIDDEAWEKELANRARCESYLFNSPVIISG